MNLGHAPPGEQIGFERTPLELQSFYVAPFAYVILVLKDILFTVKYISLLTLTTRIPLSLMVTVN